MPAWAAATSFEAAPQPPAIGAGSSRTCSAEGEMLWKKLPGGSSTYELCYAPTQVSSGSRPTGGNLKCDAGSYFMVEAPKFCCRKPRIELRGEGTKGQAVNEVCGDVLSEFDEEAQQIRVVRGPTTTGSKEQMAALDAAGYGHMVPSPLAFDALKKRDIWQPLLNVKCKGVDGTAVRWLHSTPPGRAELCPPGTTPVGGAGYASWACDGLTTREVQLHCCKVKGRQVCVRRFVDATGGADCNCRSGGLPRAEPPPEAGPPAEAAAGLGVVALSLARTARQGGGRWPPCAAGRRGWRVRRFL